MGMVRPRRPEPRRNNRKVHLTDAPPKKPTINRFSFVGRNKFVVKIPDFIDRH
jgi:hypothetical protein